MSDPASPFLPTLDRARAAGVELPPGAPDEERRVAALVVHADMIRREGWEEQAVLGQSAAEKIPRGEPDAPTSLDPQSYVRLAELIRMERCSMCPERPGRARCRICKGLGTLQPWGQACSCPDGYVECPQCEGAGEAHRVTLRYLQDQPIQLREIYVPPEMAFVPGLFSFEGSFERAVGAAPPPEALRCHDLRPRTVSTSAYRGGGKMVEPDFHGHVFAGTIDKAMEALRAAGARGRIVAQAVRAYAWPLLWLRYRAPEQEAVVFVDPEGALRAYRGEHAG